MTPDAKQALTDIAAALDILAELLTDRIDAGATEIMPAAAAQSFAGDLARHATTLRSIADGQ